MMGEDYARGLKDLSHIPNGAGLSRSFLGGVAELYWKSILKKHFEKAGMV